LDDLPDDDPYDLVDNRWPLPCCPNKYKDLATLDQARQTGRVFRCRSNGCVFCAQRNVYPLSDAIAFSRPYSMITVPDVPTRWPDLERFTKNLVQSVKRHGQPLDWVYTIERYPSVPGATLQGYLRAFVDQELVSHYSKKNGAGNVNLVKLDYNLGMPNFTYIFKSLSLSRLPSRQEATGALIDYMALNNWHMAHSTRGFFRDAFGRPIPQKKAVRQAIRRYLERQAQLRADLVNRSLGTKPSNCLVGRPPSREDFSGLLPPLGEQVKW